MATPTKRSILLRRVALAVCGFFSGSLGGKLVARAIADTPRAAYLVKDINTATRGGSQPGHLTAVNGTLFFVASDPQSGAELWKSTGTTASTVRVADIVPGPGSSRPRALTNVDGRLFFVACSADDCELWQSDGTAAGTARVADINPGAQGSGARDLTAVGDTLYFFVDAPQERAGLWKSDGTAPGTSLVVPMPGTGLVARNGTLYFRHESAIYETDGTAEGTHQLDVGREVARDFLPVGDKIFFTTASGSTGQLWTTDGTRGGTTFLADVGPAFATDDGSPLQYHLAGVTLPNGTPRLFFRTWSRDCEMWTSDGTTTGTMRLADAACLHDDEHPDGPANLGLASAGDVVVFAGCAQDGTTGCEPWRTDGTLAGTAPLADVAAGARSSYPSEFTAVGDAVFFVAFNPTSGWGLWKTDGTSHATTHVVNVAPGSFENDDPPAFEPSRGALVAVGRTLFFSGCEPRTGCDELWKSDGTPTGTVQVADIVPNPPLAGSAPEGLTAVKDLVFFSATDDDAGRELWMSDGTSDGTIQVADLMPGLLGSNVQNLTAVGDQLFFTRRTSADHDELWRTDGFTEGTRRLAGGKDAPWHAANFVDVGGTLWFAVERGSRREIWKSDGTADGTVAVAEVAGLDVGGKSAFTKLGNTLYFRACDAPSGCELWRLDLATGATQQVVDLYPGPTGSHPTGFATVAGVLYFSATDPLSGWELRRTDGTAAGTVRITEIGPGPLDAYPIALTTSGDSLYFAALEGEGYGLWRTDGTVAGTLRLAPPDGEGIPAPLAVNGKVFFRHCQPATGCEVWRTDGKPTHTRILDLEPGPKGSDPWLLGIVGGSLFFQTQEATGSFRRSQLWASDGTSTRTVRVGDAPLPGVIEKWVIAGDRLFFSLDDHQRGAELWAVSALGAPPVQPPDTCLTDCDDRNACTQDACISGECTHVPTAGACDDGDLCTVNDTCSAGRCTAGTPRSCNDDNSCTADSCRPVIGCVHVNVPNACDDGNRCTLDDVCIAGRCGSRVPLDCDDGNSCTVDACDRVRGCTHRPVDNRCDDRNRCTLGDHCVAGECRGTDTLDCDDGNPCTIDSCRRDRGCDHQWAQGACDDGDACTTGDTCQNGMCLGEMTDLECVDAVLCRGLERPAAPAGSAGATADPSPSELCSSLATGSTVTRYPVTEPRRGRAVVKLFNRFGMSAVTTMRGSSEFVRTKVVGEGIASAARGDVDRYRCRRVRGTRGASLAAPHPLTVRDDFTGARREVVVRMPHTLCTAGDDTEGTALLCYRAATMDAVSDARPIAGNNRRGTLRGRTTRVQTVCLPSTVLR